MVFIKKPKSMRVRPRKAGKAQSALTAVQKKEVKQLIKAPVETKYAGFYYFGSAPVLSAVNTPTDCRPFLAPVLQGPQDNQRIGDDISPVRAVGYWNYWFNSDLTTSSVDCMVHLLVLMSKVSAGVQTFPSLSSNTLLQTGAGTYYDPDGPDQVQMATSINKSPVNTKNWLVIARRSFRMTKNLGQQNAEATIPASNGQTSSSSKQITISFTKGIKKLSYLNPIDTQPSSHYPVFITWATTVDGRALPTGGGGPVLRVGYKADLFYKDA